MTDMLVKLYDLPREASPLPKGLTVRRASGPEKHQVVTWVSRVFSQGWADEGAVAFARQPIACFIARKNQSIVGFCTYDAPARGVVGHIGVFESLRGQGVGRRLLLTALQDMAVQGYAYAVVGWVGPEAFFTQTAQAIPIPDSSPGMYGNLRAPVDSPYPSDQGR
jgi:GNAT superfamily N-acetyltransferase